MTFDEVKQWLNRAYKIDELIQLDKKKIQEWNELATSIGSFSNSEKVQSSINTETTFVNKLFKKDEAIEKYNQRIIERYNIKEEIDEVINSIDDNEIVIVLSYRYLEFLSFRKIATLIYSNKSTVQRLHEKGIREVEKILGQRGTLTCDNIVL
ncbi:hypothetical protein HMPREF9709_01201 [Helcococcus kunzii ATCC 51366]|uniref:RNA polymerase sigma-70 region 4 domain-containing protein n=1 Tax=Helcococcus kunzii ATCC 51366 TaxID=883114 RepID=H3NPE0_9FIRM|nr:hypothetical protein [Helcococcus kunzii]EHR33453.1 hypothetical protein HMPREF9709_01201 [Helcococcus kunzii ATCC 51366]